LFGLTYRPKLRFDSYNPPRILGVHLCYPAFPAADLKYSFSFKFGVTKQFIERIPVFVLNHEKSIPKTPRMTIFWLSDTACGFFMFLRLIFLDAFNERFERFLGLRHSNQRFECRKGASIPLWRDLENTGPVVWHPKSLGGENPCQTSRTQFFLVILGSDCSQLHQFPDNFRQRQPDHVGIRSADVIHQKTSRALHGISAGLVPGFSGVYIRF